MNSYCENAQRTKVSRLSFWRPGASFGPESLTTRNLGNPIVDRTIEQMLEAFTQAPHVPRFASTVSKRHATLRTSHVSPEQKKFPDTTWQWKCTRHCVCPPPQLPAEHRAADALQRWC